jgi:hypothetical protein
MAMKPVINFMGIRNAAFAVTLVVTLISLGSLAFKGLNFGLELATGFDFSLLNLEFAGYDLGKLFQAEVGSAVTLDADGQHDPADVPSLIGTIPPGQRPIVIGRREGMAGAVEVAHFLEAPLPRGELSVRIIGSSTLNGVLSRRFRVSGARLSAGRLPMAR